MTRNAKTIHMLPKFIVESLDFTALPPEWIPTDLVRFSTRKILYDYQRDALINAVKCLYLYFNENQENDSVELKKAWYKRMQQTVHLLAGETEILDSLGIENKKDNGIVNTLKEYYLTETRTARSIDYEYIPFWNYLNRMGFWMATGSGKSLVLIKLVEILDEFLRKNLIESDSYERGFDILVLSYREDLLTQLRNLVSEYNQGRVKRIDIWDLKDYDKVKAGRVLVDKSKINIFLYRSDLISDTTTEANISFADIDNNGRWLILLDEAHKGDSEESKRQQYYSILSRNGFLFNFSATFTDPWDIATTVVNFNLSEFIKRGYGKNIYLMQDEDSLKLDSEIDDSRKRSLVLQMLVLFSYVAQSREELSSSSPTLHYHNPLLVILGKTVNTKNADLEIIFRLLEDVANGRCETTEIEDAKKLLANRFQNHRTFCFGDGQEEFTFDDSKLTNLGLDDVLKHVFHSTNPGEIEVSRNPADTKQIAFKHKNADKPFALLKIGDITTWLKEKLKGYVVTDTYDNRSYFDSLNEEKSPVTVLLGAQAFYEGWDSNRPNIMAFINIGKSDAKKYVLQAIGRGVRIEPRAGKRKRFLHLPNELSQDTDNPHGELLTALETLFIFGTSETNIERLLESVRYVEPKEWVPLSFKRNPAVDSLDFPLLIPVYSKLLDVPIEELPKFSGNRELLETFDNWINDDRILYAIMSSQIGTDLQLSTFRKTKSFISNGSFVVSSGNNPVTQISRLSKFVDAQIEDVKGCRELSEEIVHFKHITTTLDEDDVKELQEIIDRVGGYDDPELKIMQLTKDLQEKSIDGSEFAKRYEELKRIQPIEQFDTIQIKHINSHYYLPILLSENGKGQFIKHIIRVESERIFILELEKTLSKLDNQFKSNGDWMFSKLVERVDDIYIPYYCSKHNSTRSFYPDFIFWFKNGNRYRIIFIDPKGTTYLDYQEKIDGFLKIFWDGDKPIVFKHDSMEVTVHLRMFGKDRTHVGDRYQKYWMDDVAQFSEVLKE
ncbi:MAG: DEAD/DEAH box helicase family protein [Candidatus Thorarchaeota archaeon]